MGGMDTLRLFACSGLGGLQEIAAAQGYVTIMVIVSVGPAAFAAIVAWMRPPAFRETAVMSAMLAVHPGLWASTTRGDAGEGSPVFNGLDRCYCSLRITRDCLFAGGRQAIPTFRLTHYRQS